MINYNNHNINKISYNNHSIKYVYGCGGNLVWSDTPTGGTKFIATFASKPNYEVECDGNSVLTTGDTKSVSNYDMLTAEIGSCVTEIGDSALLYLTYLTSVTISNSVTRIGSNAFSSCYALTSIDIPSGVTSIGWSAFQDCSGLTSITIPSGVTRISQNVFNGCTSLSSCTLGNNITSIGNSAFQNCYALTSIDIPSGVTSIDSYAFRNCSGLTSITVRAETPPTLNLDALANTNNCPIYVPCDSVDAYKAAHNWSTHSSRIRPIEGSCTGNTKFYATFNDGVSDDYIDCDSSSLLTWQEVFTFLNNSGRKYHLLTAHIGNCVTETEYNLLAWATSTEEDSLTSVTVSNNVTTIGHSFCKGRKKLTNVKFPNGVTVIPSFCFEGCKALPSFNIPSGVTSIDTQAFNNCSGLTSIDIPPSITNIGDYAFHECRSLTSVIVRASTPPTLGSEVFSFSTGTAAYPIYVPSTSVNTYKTASGWSYLASRIFPF